MVIFWHYDVVFVLDELLRDLIFETLNRLVNCQTQYVGSGAWAMSSVEGVGDSRVWLWGNRLLVGRGVGAVEDVSVDPFDSMGMSISTPLVTTADSLSLNSGLGAARTVVLDA